MALRTLAPEAADGRADAGGLSIREIGPGREAGFLEVLLAGYQALQQRGATSCQYALFMLRWLDRAPEDFVTDPVVDVGDTRLPDAGIESRLRWDLCGSPSGSGGRPPPSSTRPDGELRRA